MIDLKKFIEMIKGANRVLIVERDYIDDLNVFPVPDGDTGSNMNATVQGATLSIENKSPINHRYLRSQLSYCIKR